MLILEIVLGVTAITALVLVLYMFWSMVFEIVKDAISNRKNRKD